MKEQGHPPSEAQLLSTNDKFNWDWTTTTKWRGQGGSAALCLELGPLDQSSPGQRHVWNKLGRTGTKKTTYTPTQLHRRSFTAIALVLQCKGPLLGALLPYRGAGRSWLSSPFKDAAEIDPDWRQPKSQPSFLHQWHWAPMLYSSFLQWATKSGERLGPALTRARWASGRKVKALLSSCPQRNGEKKRPLPSAVFLTGSRRGTHTLRP